MNWRILIYLAILVIPQMGFGDTLPTVGLTYDLQEVGLTTEPTHKGVLNQLKDVTFIHTTATDLDDVYVLKATFNSLYNGTSYGQATELMAMDIATGQILTPKNITTTGEHKCLPAITGNNAKFQCVYRSKDNKITDASKIYLFIFLPDSLILFNPKLLEPKDFIPPAPTPPAPQPLQCGNHQEILNGKCVCSSGFILDPKTKGCLPDLSLNAEQPATTTGGGCSLLRF